MSVLRVSSFVVFALCVDTVCLATAWSYGSTVLKCEASANMSLSTLLTVGSAFGAHVPVLSLHKQ